jgi:hypothetical protein
LAVPKAIKPSIESRGLQNFVHRASEPQFTTIVNHSSHGAMP